MITVVGEALLDLVASGDRRSFAAYPGGSPANVAVGLARLGVPTTLATHIGDDLPGQLIGDHLTDSGVRLTRLPANSAATSLAFAAVDQAGVATYDFRIAWDIQRGPVIASDCVCLHTGSIGAALHPGATVVDEMMASRDDLLVSYDPNIRPSLIGDHDTERERVRRQVAAADLIKVSSEDLAWLYPGEPYRTVATRWLEAGAALVVVTLGADGAYAVNHASEVDVPATPVTVVDTVGAGDAFTAGMLDQLLQAGVLRRGNRDALGDLDTASLRDVIDAASRVAAVTCSRPGADPPTRAELQRHRA